MGIDPGSIVTGFGVVEIGDGGTRPVTHGFVATSSRKPLGERLVAIHAEISQQIAKHRPDEIAVESVFHAKNVRSALMLGHARGVAILAAAQAGVPVFEYAPREVKLSVVGHGNASKAQVASMVSRLLSIEIDGMREDESDAIAVAVCHVHKREGACRK
ncbi:MAG: crossover junction endodeoxyribonuclease RuvC [Candidatus Eisenbacteria bacterium]|nr:crossover junction endodeoxyribonuclease RuvC [Candidatus Eisenbacteria bacterium]